MGRPMAHNYPNRSVQEIHVQIDGGAKTMPKYLLDVSYTLEGVRGVVAKGGNARKDAAQAAAESAGGTLDLFYFAFGGTDVVTIADLPDNEAAAALALAVTAGGGATVRTVVLLTPDQIDSATRKAVNYSPPGN
jgi:uncharacterized protein with GYD domain